MALCTELMHHLLISSALYNRDAATRGCSVLFMPWRRTLEVRNALGRV